MLAKYFMTKHRIWIGAHTSAAGGVHNALLEGQEIGASSIQLFTSNQKQWHGRTFSEEEIALWEKALEKTGIDKIMSHSSYLINLGSPDKAILIKSRKAIQDELMRCHRLGISYLNFHPGAATKGTAEQCLDTIVESLLDLESLVSQGPTQLVLETTAGQGTSVGHCFEEIGSIVSRVSSRLNVGVCIDTCHIFSAGYDIRTRAGWESTLKAFDKAIGLQYLAAFHLNDSQKELGSRVDRHASLGKGAIGLEAFQFLMESQITAHLPKYLETPEGPSVWKEEIALLKKWGEER